MHAPPRLKVSFETPANGWLGVDLRAGDQHLVDRVSHIYPGLRDLCSALCDVLNRVPSRRVVFLLEPAELELQVEPDAPDSAESWRLVARVSPDYRRDRRPPPVLEYRASVRGIVLPFWRALRRLETSVPPEGFRERFRQPFPTLEMASLTQLISTLPSTSRPGSDASG